MATPIESFQLDRKIFSPSLYTNITDFWFDGLASNDTAAPQEVMMKWYGKVSPEEKASFDNRCSSLATTALQSIDETKLNLPAFVSYEDERQKAQLLSKPFMAEIAASKNPGEILLGSLLLLDQMPRNIFREQDTLPRVYTHYDRLALALVRTSLTELRDVFPYRGLPVRRVFIYMPLMHSEDPQAHEQLRQLLNADENIAKSLHDEAGLVQLKGAADAEAQHFEPLEKFGRYPHRNECLGRANTEHEEEFLKTAETYGVKQGSQASKDEL